MQAPALRRIVVLGLVLGLAGVVVPGFHHVRCQATFTASPGGAGETTTLPCAETFPSEVAVGAALVGIVASLAALAAGLRLSALGQPSGPRALVALAAITLGVPALIILAGWGSAGFDLRLAEGDGGCHSTTPWARPPLWLQTTMCVNAFDVVRVPMLALAGIAAALGARGLDRRALLVGVGAAALAVGSIVAALVLGATKLALVWSLPVLGFALLAGGVWLARRQAQPEVAAA